MKIILGSSSPRRKELLGQLDLSFEIRTKDTDESFSTEMYVGDVPEHLAKRKAAALFSTLTEDELVICADTVVIVDDVILNKPKDKEDAVEMLMLLSGKVHQVITGVALYSLNKQHSFSVVTKVEFALMTQEEIRSYVEKYLPLDKAGSYGIQEWIGAAFIKAINGSYNNVVGLPTHEVFQALKLFA